jgi:hypothetical protein
LAHAIAGRAHERGVSVWLDDLVAGRTTDPRAHLEEVFDLR